MNDVTSEEIDILRGMAALGVIIGHTFSEKWHVLDGAFWVWIFFVTSGFLQGHFFFSGRYSLDTKGCATYYRNRLLRIAPLFWLILLLGWAASYVTHHAFDGIQFLKEFFFLESAPRTIGPLWTIACEMQFYLIVPLIIFLTVNNQHTWLALPAGIFLYAIYQFIGSTDNPGQPRLMLGILPLFLFGILIAYIHSEKYKVNAYIKLIFIVALIILALKMQILFPARFWESWGVWLASLVCIVVLLFQGRRAFVHTALSPLRFMGKYCYGVYMYAAGIGYVYTEFWQLQPGFLAFGLQMLSIPMAYVSYHGFEKIIRDKGKELLQVA